MKWLFTFAFGFAAGVTASYLMDPKGTLTRYNSLKKELADLEHNWKEKLESYKQTYNEMVDKYADAGKETIEKTKGKVHLN